MQAEPLLIIEGAVVGTRTVKVPAQDAYTFTDTSGRPVDVAAKSASSYDVAAVSVQAAYDGDPVPGVTNVLEVRLGSATPPTPGEVVRWYVSVRGERAQIRGNWVTFTSTSLRGVAPALEVARTVRAAS
jgi:hypothetical protein